jgi:hypothetical protein
MIRGYVLNKGRVLGSAPSVQVRDRRRRNAKGGARDWWLVIITLASHSEDRIMIHV